MGAMGVKGVVLSTAATELSLRLGWRFALGQRLSLRLEGERVESGHAPTDHSLVLRTSLPW